MAMWARILIPPTFDDSYSPFTASTAVENCALSQRPSSTVCPQGLPLVTPPAADRFDVLVAEAAVAAAVQFRRAHSYCDGRRPGHGPQQQRNVEMLRKEALQEKLGERQPELQEIPPAANIPVLPSKAEGCSAPRFRSLAPRALRTEPRALAGSLPSVFMTAMTPLAQRTQHRVDGRTAHCVDPDEDAVELCGPSTEPAQPPRGQQLHESVSYPQRAPPTPIGNPLPLYVVLSEDHDNGRAAAIGAATTGVAGGATAEDFTSRLLPRLHGAAGAAAPPSPNWSALSGSDGCVAWGGAEAGDLSPAASSVLPELAPIPSRHQRPTASQHESGGTAQTGSREAGGDGGGTLATSGRNSAATATAAYSRAVSRYGSLLMSSAGWRHTEIFDMCDDMALLAKLEARSQQAGQELRAGGAGCGVAPFGDSALSVLQGAASRLQPQDCTAGVEVPRALGPARDPWAAAPGSASGLCGRVSQAWPPRLQSCPGNAIAATPVGSMATPQRATLASKDQLSQPTPEDQAQLPALQGNRRATCGSTALPAAAAAARLQSAYARILGARVSEASASGRCSGAWVGALGSLQEVEPPTSRLCTVGTTTEAEASGRSAGPLGVSWGATLEELRERVTPRRPPFVATAVVGAEAKSPGSAEAGLRGRSRRLLSTSWRRLKGVGDSPPLTSPSPNGRDRSDSAATFGHVLDRPSEASGTPTETSTTAAPAASEPSAAVSPQQLNRLLKRPLLPAGQSRLPVMNAPRSCGEGPTASIGPGIGVGGSAGVDAGACSTSTLPSPTPRRIASTLGLTTGGTSPEVVAAAAAAGAAPCTRSGPGSGGNDAVPAVARHGGPGAPARAPKHILRAASASHVDTQPDTPTKHVRRAPSRLGLTASQPGWSCAAGADPVVRADPPSCDGRAAAVAGPSGMQEGGGTGRWGPESGGSRPTPFGSASLSATAPSRGTSRRRLLARLSGAGASPSPTARCARARSAAVHPLLIAVTEGQQVAGRAVSLRASGGLERSSSAALVGVRTASLARRLGPLLLAPNSLLEQRPPSLMGGSCDAATAAAANTATARSRWDLSSVQSARSSIGSIPHSTPDGRGDSGDGPGPAPARGEPSDPRFTREADVELEFLDLVGEGADAAGILRAGTFGVRGSSIGAYATGAAAAADAGAATASGRGKRLKLRIRSLLRALLGKPEGEGGTRPHARRGDARPSGDERQGIADRAAPDNGAGCSSFKPSRAFSRRVFCL